MNRIGSGRGRGYPWARGSDGTPKPVALPRGSAAAEFRGHPAARPAFCALTGHPAANSTGPGRKRGHLGIRDPDGFPRLVAPRAHGHEAPYRVPCPSGRRSARSDPRGRLIRNGIWSGRRPGYLGIRDPEGAAKPAGRRTYIEGGWLPPSCPPGRRPASRAMVSRPAGSRIGLGRKRRYLGIRCAVGLRELVAPRTCAREAGYRVSTPFGHRRASLCPGRPSDKRGKPGRAESADGSGSATRLDIPLLLHIERTRRRAGTGFHARPAAGQRLVPQ